jgi:hypothetical protein
MTKISRFSEFPVFTITYFKNHFHPQIASSNDFFKDGKIRSENIISNEQKVIEKSIEKL